MTSRRLTMRFALALLLAAGMPRTVVAQDLKNTLPASVGDLAAAQLIEIRDEAGQVLLHGTLQTSKNNLEETEREAELVSPSGQKAKGTVEIEVERRAGLVIKDEVEVEAERLPGMLTCSLFIDGRHVTTFTTSRAGKVELKLERKATVARV